MAEGFSVFKIQAGDIVTIRFASNSPSLHHLKVLYVPQSPGDCWRFIERSGGAIFYVQQFEQIELVLKKEK